MLHSVFCIGAAEFEANFGDARAAAFLIDGGRSAISLGGSGVDVRQASLKGLSVSAAPAVDPVSRIVVFPVNGQEGLRISGTARIGTVLTANGVSYRVDGLVKQVGGRYLPFTLLRLKGSGDSPLPGTPLLGKSGTVVAVAHESAGNGRIYALPAEVVNRAIERARQGDQTRAWMGFTLNPQSRIPKVVRVVSGSPAEQAGLVPGDVLVSVAGRRVVDYGDAVNAFYFLKPGQSVKIAFRREKRSHSVMMTPSLASR